MMKKNMRITNAKAVFWGLGVTLFTLIATNLSAFPAPQQLSQTDFTGFTTGASVDGQGGWDIGFGAPNITVDEEVEDDGTGNTVFRLSNAVGSGSLGDMPYAPRPAGIPNFPADSISNPVLGQPDLFAGESSTNALHRRFAASLDFRSATGAAQNDLSVSVSPDNGSGGRMSFVRFADSGSGIDLVTFDVDAAGNFIGPQTITTGLSYTTWHKLTFEIFFVDGPTNDLVNIYLNDALIHTGTTWEDYYRASDPTSYPLGAPVQTLVFSAGNSPEPGNNGGGIYFDNVITEVGALPKAEVPTLSQWGYILLASGLIGIAAWHLRKRQNKGLLS